MRRQSANRLQTIYAALAGGVIVLDAASRILDANETAARILGADVAQLRGALLSHTAWETAYPAGLEWPDADSPIALALRTRGPVLDVTMHIVRPNGDLQRLRVDITPFLDAGGEVAELAIQFVDLTAHHRPEERHRTVEARYRALVERLPNITYMFTPDDASEMLYMSPQIEAILGYSAEEWQSSPDLWKEMLYPDDRDRVVGEIERAVRAGEPFDLEYRSFDRAGRVVWLSDKTVLIHDEAGRPWYFQGLMTDITAYKTLEQTLRESEGRLRSVVANAPVILLALDHLGIITFFEGKGLAKLGLEPGQHLGRSFFEIYGELPEVLDQARRALGGEELTAIHEISGVVLETHWTPLHAQPGALAGAIAVSTDITERRRAEQALHYQATHDALTRLPNRVLLQDRLEQGLRAARRHETPLALLFIDLNRFKEVNDTLGHASGDLLLRQVSERFRAIVRAGDTVARLGGDEFAMLLPATDEARARSIAERVAQALEEPFVVEGQLLDVGASVGIALFPDHGADAATLLRCADIAMYLAKRTGLDYAVYDAMRDRDNRRRLALQRDLQHALARRELFLAYQPLVDLGDNRLVGVEALLRWRHAQHGLIAPDVFIPLAEQSGVIGSLTTWVLEEALRQCQEWRRMGLHLNVSINLSMRVLHDAQLPETLAELLRRYAVVPRMVTLEVTESTLMTDPIAATAILARLNDLGVRISIDDFGTGYSSLAYLKQLPVHEIKIDKSFIMGLHARSKDAPLVSSIAAMAQALGLDIVAEGVETEEAFEALAPLPGLMIQGYHISRPLPAPDLQRWAAGSCSQTDVLSA